MKKSSIDTESLLDCAAFFKYKIVLHEDTKKCEIWDGDKHYVVAFRYAEDRMYKIHWLKQQAPFPEKKKKRHFYDYEALGVAREMKGVKNVKRTLP